MSIGRDDVLHVARLAELAVAESELPTLVQQLNRIVAFVEELNEVPAGDAAAEFVAGPDQVVLRPDVVRPVPLARTPEEMAPEFIGGFYVVPRLGAMDGGDE